MGAVHAFAKGESFQSIIDSNEKVIVDFYADWCGPCRMIAPVLEELANKYPNIKFVKVNVDDHQDVAQSGPEPVSRLPTLRFYHKGAVKQTVFGADVKKIRENAEAL